MTITIKTDKVTAVLLAGGGWQSITLGSLEIEDIALKPDPLVAEADDYGFTFTDETGTVKGRMSALLAVREGE